MTTVAKAAGNVIGRRIRAPSAHFIDYHAAGSEWGNASLALELMAEVVKLVIWLPVKHKLVLLSQQIRA